MAMPPTFQKCFTLAENLQVLCVRRFLSSSKNLMSHNINPRPTSSYKTRSEISMDNVDGSSACISLLTDEVIEIILASLPITDLFNAALVCKEWRSFVASSHLLRAVSYSIHASKPWLFVLGQSRSLSAQNRAIGFDPLAWRWNRIDLPASIDSKKLEEPRTAGIMMNVEEGNGILFYVAGRRIKYSLSFLNPKCKWEESPPMNCWRHQHPVVCYLGGPTHNHIFVVGGVSDFEGEEIDPLCAEMLDLNSGVWKSLDPLPYQFNASASSTWLSSAVFNDRIYLLERYSGDCCYFDLQRKRWEYVGKLRPPQSSCSVVQYSGLILVSGNSKKGLVVGALQQDDGGMSFRLWNFNNIVGDEASNNIVCREMARMPSQMYNLVTGKDDEEEEGWEKSSDVKCKGTEDLIYIYSDRSEHVCVCDISGHGQLWRMLPDRDELFVGTYHYSRRFKYACSPVTLDQISL